MRHIQGRKIKTLLGMIALMGMMDASRHADAASGLPVPRFVSLKSGTVNVRQGPSRNHEVIFVFKKAGLPVEVTAEFDNWRKIRDAEGEEGWIWHSLLSNRRTALVTPWDNETSAELHAKAEETAERIAYVQGNVLVAIKNCDTIWCYVTASDKQNERSGYIKQEALWGVYPDEAILE